MSDPAIPKEFLPSFGDIPKRSTSITGSLSVTDDDLSARLRVERRFEKYDLFIEGRAGYDFDTHSRSVGVGFGITF